MTVSYATRLYDPKNPFASCNIMSPNIDCACDEAGRQDNSCEKLNGICHNCKLGFTGDKCSACESNFAPSLGDDKCTQCIEGYYGAACDKGKKYNNSALETTKDGICHPFSLCCHPKQYIRNDCPTFQIRTAYGI